MKGKLYAVGIGPGDPDLMTLKAVKVLESVEVVCVPKGKREGESIALGIVEQAVALQGKSILEIHFPMVKGSRRDALKRPAEDLLRVIEGGRDAAFITLGDPTLYSTFFHLHDAMLHLDRDVTVEIIPGVSSINAAGSRAGLSLALSGERLAVLPAAYGGELKEILAGFDTVVLMKVHSVFREIKDTLSDMGLLDGAVYVSRIGMPDELVKPASEVLPGELNYFSTIIVRTRHG